MKNIIAFLFVLVFAFSVQAQRAVWIQLHDSGLDTLTGVAADSITESVNLNYKFGGGLFGGSQVLSPRYVAIETAIVEDINNGEGMTIEPRFGFSSGFTTASLDTIFTAPTAPGGAVVRLYDMRAQANAGNRLNVINTAYASAADTDSLSYRQRVYGLFEVD